MHCEKCGAEIERGLLYCKRCGTRVKIVEDYSSLEDVLAGEVNNIMNNNEKSDIPSETYDYNKKNNYYNENDDYDYDDEDYREINKKNNKKHKKTQKNTKKKKIIISLIVIGIVIIAAIITAFMFSNSYTRFMNKAAQALEEKRYEEAFNYFEKAMQKASQKADPYVGKGKVYKEKKEYDNAINMLRKAIELEPGNTEAYYTLCKIYEEKNDKEAISNLFKDITDSAVLKKCSDYYCNKVSFSIEEGVYTEPISLKLSADNNFKIYYTLDGTKPTLSSTIYDKEIELNMSGDVTVTAIAVNTAGYFSLPNAVTYKMNLQNLLSPDVKPATGTYTDYFDINIGLVDGCEIYYTFDGSEPTESSYKYEKPIKLSASYIINNDININSITFNAIAIETKTGRKSSVTSRLYNIIINGE